MFFGHLPATVKIHICKTGIDQLTRCKGQLEKWEGEIK
jgi:hypothetical protein